MSNGGCMDQWFSLFTDPAEDWDMFPAHILAAHNCLKLLFKELLCFFWTLQEYNSMWYIYRQPHIYIIKVNKYYILHT